MSAYKRPAYKDWQVRTLHPGDFEALETLSRRVYPLDEPWEYAHFKSHYQIFPEGQFVACDPKDTSKLAGAAFSLMINWDDYETLDNWDDFTDEGFFTNHDPGGVTLYGAEVMTSPDYRGRGVGSALYAARRQLAKDLGVRRIRAGARMRGYSRYADQLAPEEYLMKVVDGEIFDPTLSFQLKQGFKILSLVPQYLEDDPETLGYAALIEWLNPDVATEAHKRAHDAAFERNVAKPLYNTIFLSKK